MMLPSPKIQLVIAAWLALVLAVGGCGDDDDGNGGGATQAADPERYCELSRQLDEDGTEFFRKLERDPRATEEDFEQAERDFVEAHESDLEELEGAAPAEIRSEVETLIASTRGRAGLGPEIPEAEATSAETAVQRFEKQSCPA